MKYKGLFDLCEERPKPTKPGGLFKACNCRSQAKERDEPFEHPDWPIKTKGKKKRF